MRLQLPNQSAMCRALSERPATPQSVSPVPTSSRRLRARRLDCSERQPPSTGPSFVARSDGITITTTGVEDLKVRPWTVCALVALSVLTASCGSDNSECYTTGEPGSAQEERDIERASKWGCDEVTYEGVE